MSFQQQNNLVGKKIEINGSESPIMAEKTPYDEKSKIF